MLMRIDITLRGKWLYPREAVAQMIRLVRSGLIHLAQFDLTEFGMDSVNEAVHYAAANAGPLRLTVLRPDWLS
jgi:alcohol dehydrogenase